MVLGATTVSAAIRAGRKIMRGVVTAICVSVTLATLALAGAATMSDAQCGPFGDPPAQVRHGLIANLVSNTNPVCFGGKLLGPWADSGGSDRYACLYEPKSAGAENPLPLVVFLHGSLATADTILLTGLTGRVDDADLGGARRGFIMIAPEGREATHHYPGLDKSGLGWDNWYRQLEPSGDAVVSGTTCRENDDAAAIDHFVEDEASTGKVDRKRIYLMGWSNGAAMAILYGLNRPQVAAAAVYSAPDPFGAFDDPCAQTPVAHPPAGVAEVEVFNPGLPILHVRNSCDIEGICPNGDTMVRQLHALGGDLEDVILDSSQNQVARCEDACGTNPMAGGRIGVAGEFRGLKNHVAWPKRWNDRMFDFLKRHSGATGNSLGMAGYKDRAAFLALFPPSAGRTVSRKRSEAPSERGVASTGLIGLLSSAT